MDLILTFVGFLYDFFMSSHFHITFIAVLYNFFMPSHPHAILTTFLYNFTSLPEHYKDMLCASQHNPNHLPYMNTQHIVC